MPAIYNNLYCRMLFNDANDPEGWSEGYWLSETAKPAAWAWVINTLFPVRRALMANDSVLYDIMITKANIRGDSYRGGPLPNAKQQDRTFNRMSARPNAGLPGHCCVYYTMMGFSGEVKATRPLHSISLDALDPPIGPSRQIRLKNEWQPLFKRFADALKEGVIMVNVFANAAPKFEGILLSNISEDSRYLTINPVGSYKIPKKEGFWANIENESIKFIRRTPEDPFTWEVEKGFNGTTRATHAGGSKIFGAAEAAAQKVPVSQVFNRETVAYRKTGRPFGIIPGRRAAKRT